MSATEDAVPFDRAPTVPAGWSIVSDGGNVPSEATARADHYRSHGRRAIAYRYMARALDMRPYVAYRVIVDIAPDDATWEAYRASV